MKFKKILDKTYKTKTISFREALYFLNALGYEQMRIKGSHYVFKSKTLGIASIPVHNNEVKTVYIKIIIKLLNERNISIQLFDSTDV